MPTAVNNLPNSNGIAIFSPFPPDGVAVSTVGTGLEMLKQYLIKGGTLGPNGSLELDVLLSWTSSANSKEIQLRLAGDGGFMIFGQSLNTNVATQRIKARFGNQNNAAVQVGFASSSTGVGQVSGSKFTGALNTNADFTIEIWAAAFTAPEIGQVEHVVSTLWQG